MPFRATGFRSEAEPAPKQTAALNVLAVSGDSTRHLLLEELSCLA